jgi:hypothetical protein
MAIARSPGAAAYTDTALTVDDVDDETLDLLTVTTGARAAIAHGRRIALLTAGDRPVPAVG